MCAGRLPACTKSPPSNPEPWGNTRQVSAKRPSAHRRASLIVEPHHVAAVCISGLRTSLRRCNLSFGRGDLSEIGRASCREREKLCGGHGSVEKDRSEEVD